MRSNRKVKWGMLVLLASAAVSASASTITFTLDQSNNCCGTGPFGWVTITDVGTGPTAYVMVTETLNTGVVYANGSGKEALFYNLSVSSGTVTVANLNDTTNYRAATGAQSGPPYGSFYGAITCITCSGGNAGNPHGPLSFELHDSTTALTTKNFIANGSSAFFASDVGVSGNTGDVASFLGVTAPTPEPGTFWLASAMFGLALMGLRYRPRSLRK